MSVHVWGPPDADGVKQCKFCPTRMAEGERWVWQRKKGARWRLWPAEACGTASPAVTPEPAPVRTDSPAVWPFVIADAPRVADEASTRVLSRLLSDMSARHEEGIRKYGVPLQVENGRNPAVDAYQEALDLTVYARQQWERHHTRMWWVIYEDALKLAARICAALMMEGEP
jgi:hypothetical protein